MAQGMRHKCKGDILLEKDTRRYSRKINLNQGAQKKQELYCTVLCFTTLVSGHVH